MYSPNGIKQLFFIFALRFCFHNLNSISSCQSVKCQYLVYFTQRAVKFTTNITKELFTSKTLLQIMTEKQVFSFYLVSNNNIYVSKMVGNQNVIRIWLDLSARPPTVTSLANTLFHIPWIDNFLFLVISEHRMPIVDCGLWILVGV